MDEEVIDQMRRLVEARVKIFALELVNDISTLLNTATANAKVSRHVRLLPRGALQVFVMCNYVRGLKGCDPNEYGCETAFECLRNYYSDSKFRAPSGVGIMQRLENAVTNKCFSSTEWIDHLFREIEHRHSLGFWRKKNDFCSAVSSLQYLVLNRNDQSYVDLYDLSHAQKLLEDLKNHFN
jgi:hypothetical protein